MDLLRQKKKMMRNIECLVKLDKQVDSTTALVKRSFAHLLAVYLGAIKGQTSD